MIQVASDKRPPQTLIHIGNFPAQSLSPDQHRPFPRGHSMAAISCSNPYIQTQLLSEMKGLSPLRREETFPGNPSEAFPTSLMGQNQFTCPPISGKGPSHAYRDLLLNQGRDHHPQSHVDNGQMPKQNRSSGSKGRKRGCWVDICSSSRSSQLIPLFNMHTQTSLSLNSTAPSWAVQGLERDEDSVPACCQPSLHSLSVLILVHRSLFSLIFPPVGSTT